MNLQGVTVKVKGNVVLGMNARKQIGIFVAANITYHFV